MTRAPFRLLCALSLAWWVSACSQADGDPCQVTSDCAGGLQCCVVSELRGECRDVRSCSGSDDEGDDEVEQDDSGAE